MKTFFTKSALYLALTIPAFFFLGCDDSEEGGSYEFSVEPTVLTFSAKQETQTLSSAHTATGRSFCHRTPLG